MAKKDILYLLIAVLIASYAFLFIQHKKTELDNFDTNSRFELINTKNLR